MSENGLNYQFFREIQGAQAVVVEGAQKLAGDTILHKGPEPNSGRDDVISVVATGCFATELRRLVDRLTATATESH